MRQTDPSKLRKIRLSMGYTFQDFAELIGIPFGTYSSYEQGHRPVPIKVLTDAVEAQKRDVKFFKELPKRVDEALRGKAVPNEARKGEW